jgi:hypothetical protein
VDELQQVIKMEFDVDPLTQYIIHDLYSRGVP